MRKIAILFSTEFLISACGNEKAPTEGNNYTGGPCDYEKIEATYTVTEIFGNNSGYQLEIVANSPENQTKLESSYTSKSVPVINDKNLNLSIGDHFIAEYTIMTHGSCDPEVHVVYFTDSICLEVGVPE